MSDELFPLVAERFKALAEPARLRILDALRHGELTVGELVERTRLNQANLSKHLQLLHALAFVSRRKDGLFVRYRLIDEDVFRLCDIMCGRIAQAPRARVSAPVEGTRPRPSRQRNAPAKRASRVTR